MLSGYTPLPFATWANACQPALASAGLQCDAKVGPEAIETWPDEIRSLALPIYNLDLQVHLLPEYSPWLWEPLHAGFDLSRTCSTSGAPGRRIRPRRYWRPYSGAHTAPLFLSLVGPVSPIIGSLV